MTTPPTEGAASPTTTLLAAGCVAGWTAAATCSGRLGIWLALGGAAITLGTFVVLFDRASSRALLRPNQRSVIIGVVVGGAMIGASHLVYPLVVRHAPLIELDVNLLYAAFRAPPLPVAALALAPVVLGEELVWRGLVQTTLTRRFGSSAGVALATGAYALAHAPLGSPTLVLGALLCGLAWGILRAVTGSLVPTIAAHLLWNVVVLMALPLDLR